MSILLRIVGIIWALIGVVSIAPTIILLNRLNLLPDALLRRNAFTSEILQDILKFVLVGLVVYGIGAGIAKRNAAAIAPAAAAPAQIPKPSIEERLKQLENMRAQGLIRPDEYEARRAAILREV